jgi:hypothetical protein
VEEGDAAAGDDAFLDRGAGRVHGVLDPVLALLHFGFRGAADPDDGDAAGGRWTGLGGNNSTFPVLVLVLRAHSSTSVSKGLKFQPW